MNFLFVCYEHQRLHFLAHHIRALESEGFLVRVHVLDSLANGRRGASRRGILDIPHQVSFIVEKFFRQRPSVVVSITPKAGLLCLLARFFSFTRVGQIRHVHWFTGQVWCNERGFRRWIFKLPDRLLARFATGVFLDSRAQLDYLHSEGISISSAFIPGRGSVCGVDDEVFAARPTRNPGGAVHSEGVPADVLKIGIVGRVCEDKGIAELMGWMTGDRAPDRLGLEFKFFGSMEFSNEGNRERFLALTSKLGSGWRYCGDLSEKAAIYGSIDVLLLASQREGFSTVLVEAQAFGVPVIVRRIYGVRDSYIDGGSGRSFSTAQELLVAIEFYRSSRQRLIAGDVGYEYARENFRRSEVIAAITDGYKRLLS